MRLSLTRKQLEAAPAASLLSLLDEITGDGIVTDDEVKKLNTWINENEQANLPSVAYLKILLQEILSDGKITPDERRSILIAAERVLPPDRREIARARRIAAESAAEIKAKSGKQDEQQRIRESREVNRPTGYFDFMVSGVKYEGRGRVIREHLKIGDTVFLARDPTNKYDSNAVSIRLLNGLDIGYVPREHAVDMAPLLDSGHKQKSFCKKLLGDLPIPVIVAALHSGHATIDGAIQSDSIPERTKAPKSGIGCGGRVLALIVIPAALLLAMLLR